MKRSTLSGLAALLLLAALLAGCGDDPFAVEWEENPIETTLYALDRQELNRPSAYDMFQRRRVVLESVQSQGRWDFAVERIDGQLHLLPPRALGVTSEAAIAPVPDVAFEDLREAPSDTAAYVTGEPVPLEYGVSYAVRTHRQPGQFGRQCSFYGKLEAVSLNVEEGIVIFRNDTSPECGSRRLVPRGS